MSFPQACFSMSHTRNHMLGREKTIEPFKLEKAFRIRSFQESSLVAEHVNHLLPPALILFPSLNVTTRQLSFGRRISELS